MTLKTLGIIAGGVLLAFGSGWCTGASSRSDLALQLSDTTIRADVAEVRASILDARLSLAQANFGDARRAVQHAQVVADRLQVRLRETGRADQAGAVQTVITRLGDAERLSGALDATASDAAADALRSLEASVPVLSQ
ncbi:MAG: hypothetical protein IT183_10510 [Acidobacteria bacterium]|nr:hypothetical protein [Acidobacteriota bacterium]